VAFAGPDPAAARRSHRLRIATLVLGAGLLAWQSRAYVLTAIGSWLTVDEAPTPVAMMVVSLASVRADALEVARLYHDGISGRIVLARWQDEPLDDDMRRLGVPWVPPHELAVAVLVKSGVPVEAIQVLDGTVDGLNSEITTIARFVRTSAPPSVLYVTARNHGRRAQWLLRRLLPESTTVLVHAPLADEFHPDTWWHSRTRSREVAMEYLRWANTFGLHDLWHSEPPSVPE
jgi:uncharacterized SAM-binding protein YcdF (DUF218 family)